MKPKYILSSLVPGVLLIGLGFVCGMQGNVFFGLLGFLAFFTVGVTLIVEGWKNRKREREKE